MKEQLEEAIEEIGSERLQDSVLELETPEKWISEIVAAAPSAASLTLRR